SSLSGQEINLCTGVETSVLDLVKALATCAESRPEIHFAPPRPGDIYRSLGDPTKAERLLGFRANISLEQGLRKTFDWMRTSIPQADDVFQMR
ncbi:MAG: GDP-mannose 4,6-dehydratase, partial [Anaerolineales bacterium]|nr:GDP-mannose 4,6-dehydratase [Anaerolineales bacterium]